MVDAHDTTRPPAGRDVRLDLLEAHMGRTRVRRALDLGRGAETCAADLLRLSEEVHAVAAPAARRAAAGLPITVVEARPDDLPYADGTFDLVCLFHAGDGLADPAVVREASRVLRPGGLLALSVPARSWTGAAPDARATRATVRLAMTRARLCVERCTGTDVLLGPLLAFGRAWRALRPVLLWRVRAPERRDVSAAVAVLRRWLLCVESFWTRRIDAPVGMSVLAFARKRRPLRRRFPRLLGRLRRRAA